MLDRYWRRSYPGILLLNESIAPSHWRDVVGNYWNNSASISNTGLLYLISTFTLQMLICQAPPPVSLRISGWRAGNYLGSRLLNAWLFITAVSVCIITAVKNTLEVAI